MADDAAHLVARAACQCLGRRPNVGGNLLERQHVDDILAVGSVANRARVRLPEIDLPVEDEERGLGPEVFAQPGKLLRNPA